MYVPLEATVIRKLNALAERERRRPQDQAAVLIEHALGLRVECAQLEPAQPRGKGEADAA